MSLSHRLHLRLVDDRRGLTPQMDLELRFSDDPVLPRNNTVPLLLLPPLLTGGLDRFSVLLHRLLSLPLLHTRDHLQALPRALPHAHRLVIEHFAGETDESDTRLPGCLLIAPCHCQLLRRAVNFPSLGRCVLTRRSLSDIRTGGVCNNRVDPWRRRSNIVLLI